MHAPRFSTLLSCPLRARGYLFVALLALAGTPASAQAWVPVTPMPGGPRARHATAVLDGKIYVLGGVGPNGQALDRAERYDPATDTWERLEDLRDERAGAAAAVYGGTIVVMGGREGDGEITDDVEVWNRSRERWESFDHLDRGRSGLAAAVIDGHLYAVGGILESGSPTASVEYYYGSGWEAYPQWDLVVPRERFTCTVAPDGQGGEAAYAIGGFSQFGPLDLVQRYGRSIPTTELDPILPARGAHAAAVIGGDVFVMGGRGSEDRALADVQRLDAAAGTWSAMTPLPEAREGAAAAAVNGRLYVFGGQDVLGAYSAAVWTLEPVVTGEAAPGPRGAALAAPYPNPASGVVAFSFSLDAADATALDVLDARGRVVATVAAGPHASGPHEATFDAGVLPAGVYFARLQREGAAPEVRPFAVVR